MHHQNLLHRILTFLIAFVWLANGLYCKLLNAVPRHQQIVAEILGTQQAPLFTQLIGAAEIIIAIWIISGIKSRLCAALQISVVAVMNLLEFLLVPQLLLFGKWNAFFALLFILIVYIHTFVIHKRKTRQPYLWSPS